MTRPCHSDMTLKLRKKDIDFFSIYGEENNLERLPKKFFFLPASLKYHLNYQGGLYEHCKNVFSFLQENIRRPDLPLKSAFRMAMYHDLCKTEYYTPDAVGFSTFKYNKKPRFKDVRHSALSCAIIAKLGIEIAPQELEAIRWHMGLWDITTDEEKEEMSEAMKRNPYISYLQIADMYATHYMERGK